MTQEIEFRNAKYNQHGTIDVELNHPAHGWIPFTASPDDIEPLGRHVFQLASDGDVAEYQPDLEALAKHAREKRDTMLLEIDAIVSNPLRYAELTEAELESISARRQALLDVPQQKGFPLQIEWP